MDIVQLARWTPIRLDVSGAAPTIDWCDLSDVRFTAPFFDQDVARYAASRPVVRTGLDALIKLNEIPGRAPSGLIFHLSRCGSTLVTRLLQTMPETLVIVEPAPLNALLRLPPHRVDEATRIRVIGLLIRAFGRARGDEDGCYVLKLSSWNVRRAALIRAALPDVPIMWLQRDPAAVAASLRGQPPGWIQAPGALQAIFDMAPTGAQDDILGGALAAMLAAADTLTPDLVLDYRDLPQAVWQRIAPWCGLSPTLADRTRMLEQARFSAKSAAPIPFDSSAAGLLDAVRLDADVAARLQAAYDTLDRLRPCGWIPEGELACSS